MEDGIERADRYRDQKPDFFKRIKECEKRSAQFPVGQVSEEMLREFETRGTISAKPYISNTKLELTIEERARIRKYQDKKLDEAYETLLSRRRIEQKRQELKNQITVAKLGFPLIQEPKLKQSTLFL